MPACVPQYHHPSVGLTMTVGNSSNVSLVFVFLDRVVAITMNVRPVRFVRAASAYRTRRFVGLTMTVDRVRHVTQVNVKLWSRSVESMMTVRRERFVKMALARRSHLSV